MSDYQQKLHNAQVFIQKGLEELNSIEAPEYLKEAIWLDKSIKAFEEAKSTLWVLIADYAGKNE